MSLRDGFVERYSAPGLVRAGPARTKCRFQPETSDRRAESTTSVGGEHDHVRELRAREEGRPRESIGCSLTVRLEAPETVPRSEGGKLQHVLDRRGRSRRGAVNGNSSQRPPGGGTPDQEDKGNPEIAHQVKKTRRTSTTTPTTARETARSNFFSPLGPNLHPTNTPAPTSARPTVSPRPPQSIVWERFNQRANPALTCRAVALTGRAPSRPPTRASCRASSSAAGTSAQVTQGPDRPV